MEEIVALLVVNGLFDQIVEYLVNLCICTVSGTPLTQEQAEELPQKSASRKKKDRLARNQKDRVADAAEAVTAEVTNWLENRTESDSQAGTPTPPSELGDGVLPRKLQRRMEREAAILSDSQHAKHSPEAVRRTIWRTVVRANYFWINPDTQRPAALRMPDDFVDDTLDEYISWQAEQEERVGRSVPTREHLQSIRSDLREFISKAEFYDCGKQLVYLAFLLRYEELKTLTNGMLTLSKVAMQRRIAIAFKEDELTKWKGLEVFKKAGIEDESWADEVPRGPLKATAALVAQLEAELAALESIWAAQQ